MAARIFIDGQAGTTGLKIRERLRARTDVDVVTLPEEARRDVRARETLLNSVDLAILCLPDDAAREAVALIRNPAVKVLDASSAHRTTPGWVYGLPELVSDQRGAIARAARVSNPGCHATGFIASIRPLVDARLVPPQTAISVHSLSGYSGAGKEMIAAYEAESSAGGAPGFALYGLELAHKHGAEMRAFGGLERVPLFVPGIGNFRCGLVTVVPLHLWALPGTVRGRDVHEALAERYRGEKFVRVMPFDDRAELRGGKYLDAELVNGTNWLDLFVYCNDERREAVVVARFDNLGKGASGAAVQNMNLMLGLTEGAGLDA